MTFRINHPWRLGACVVASIVFGSGTTIAAGSPLVLKKAESIPLPGPASNGRDYLLHVGFPNSYDSTDVGRRYPVIYVCDPHLDFPLVASAADFIRRDGHAPEAIVVGLGYGGTDPDVGLLRQWDLTPGIDRVYDSTGARTGHAEEFLTVLAEEIIPFVEATYRVDPEHRVLMGTSFGGLFTCYAAFKRPGLFQGFVASSPSLGWSDDYVLRLARDHAASGAAMNARMFLSWGSGDGEELVADARSFVMEVAELKIPGLRIAARVIDGAGHSGNKPESFTRGLRYVFAPEAWVPVVGTDPGYGSLGRMVNLSTRGFVDGGERILIGGLVIDGVLPKRVLLRAAGPGLADLGVTDPLRDPHLRVVNHAGDTVGENDNWGDAAEAANVAAAAIKAGAFAFAPGSLDAAMIMDLSPGSYTVLVDGVGSTSGIALVEAYELGPRP